MEEVRRLKRENKEGMEKQEDLMASAKLLQGRIHSQNKVGISYFFLLMLCAFSYFASVNNFVILLVAGKFNGPFL